MTNLDIHATRRDQQKADQDFVNAIAANLWTKFTAEQRAIVRFGMLPADEAEQATAGLVVHGINCRDAGRLLAVALMNLAEKNGGMIA